MTREQEYFLKLISSHLNNEIPEAPENINFEELFKVSDIQSMTAIAAVELKKLRNENKLSKDEFSPFNQVLGLTIQNYEYKIKGIALLDKALTDNKIRHMFVKGASIRPLYPVPEVRTSGDTDVIIESDKLDVVSQLLIDNGFELIRDLGIECDMTYCGEEYEIKRYLEYHNKACEDIYNDVFSDSISVTTDGITYCLKPLYHLVYITYHILKHFKSGGAGIRQLTDIDVVLRNNDIDINEYFSICKKIEIEKSAKVLVALAKKWFNTPVSFDYAIDPGLEEMLENVMLSGGPFGYGISNVGTARLMNTINKSDDNSSFSSVKAVLGLFVIDRNSLYKSYKFARERHILLPAAYFARLYEAVFKRGKQNVKHIKSMFTDRETATMISDMLNELEI